MTVTVFSTYRPSYNFLEIDPTLYKEVIED